MGSVVSYYTIKPDGLLSNISSVKFCPTTSTYLLLLLVHFTLPLSTMPPRQNTASKSQAPVDASVARPRGRPPKSKVVKSKQLIDDEAEEDV